MTVRKLREWCIERVIFMSGITSIVIVILIFIFLLKEGLAILGHVGIFQFLFGRTGIPSLTRRNSVHFP